MKLNTDTMQRGGAGGAIGAMLGIALMSVQGLAALAQEQHTLPLVTSADSPRQGFVRVINLSDRAGTVTIHGIDDSGERSGPITLDLGAEETTHFNSTSLERGDPDKGLSAGIGDGEGDWRLELTTELSIEPLAYIRTSDGFVTSMHDVVSAEYVPGTPGIDDLVRYQVRFFNPGSNRNQVSRLRVINITSLDIEITITGVDDDGEPAPAGDVQLTLPPYGARTVTSQQLEQGGGDLEGRLGDGKGKWQLTVTAESPAPVGRRVARSIQVMSLLLSTETGNLANLSAIGADNDSNRGTPGTDWVWGGDGDDVLNPGDNDSNYDSIAGSEGNDRIVYTDSGATAYQFLGYYPLDTGIRATINGVTNKGTVDKGSSGSDTIVDIVNPLNAAREPPYGGFGMGGTRFDDRFDLTLDDGQWMEVRGEEGADSYVIRDGEVRINFRYSPGAVDVDLPAGRVNDDGYGNVETIVGRVREIEGGQGDDTLRAKDDTYRLRGGRGNDTLRGTDGEDRLGGGAGDDTLLGFGGRDRLDGGDGDDLLNPGHAVERHDEVHGSAGNDRIVYSDTASTGSQNLFYDRPWEAQPSILPDTDGIVVTVDGPANRATVDKGPDGRDTIVDVEKPLTGWGLSLYGTRADDRFDLALGHGQWMQVEGGPGRDRFILRTVPWESESRPGSGIRINYQHSANGIDVDLRDGIATNDGFGSVDTFTLPDHGVALQGSNFTDRILGTDNGETFIPRHGNDFIDGRGGRDQIRYDRSEVQYVDAALDVGDAFGTWQDGTRFTHTFTSIEQVRGSNGNDFLYGSSGDDRFEGRNGNDRIEGRAGNDRLQGGGGADTFVFGHGHGDDRIDDFSPGEDRIDLNALGLTDADVMGASSETERGTWIDLTGFGGGTLDLRGVDPEELSTSDFLL